MADIGRALESDWRAVHADCERNGFSLSPDARAARIDWPSSMPR